MLFVTFNGGVFSGIKKSNLNNLNLSEVLLCFLPLEVGNINNPVNSKTNQIFYNVIAGKNSYLNFKLMIKQNIEIIKKLDRSQDVYFWIDFNDVRQFLNFAYFVDLFDDFKNKFIVEYDFNYYCENPTKINNFLKNKKEIDIDFLKMIKKQYFNVKKDDNAIFRTVVDGKLISVKDDYFDKFIMEFLSEKPKLFMQIIEDISAKYGRMTVTFDQAVIRLWILMREGVVERVGHGGEFGLFFEYQYKLSDHIDMQKYV